MIRAAALTALSFCLIASGCTPDRSESAQRLAPDYAATDIDLSTPKASAYSMMIAMYRGDVEMIDQIFTPQADLNRLRADGSVHKNGLTPWRDWVGTLEVGQADEQLFNIKTQQYGRLATVWAPFVISLGGEVRGCGVNQFTMVDMGEDGASQWRIVSGIDVQAPRETCTGFRENLGTEPTQKHN